MRRNDMVLGVVTLGLYLLCGVVSVVRPGPYLPPAWVYVPSGLLAGFMGYRLVIGQTYHLGQYVALVVLSLTILTISLPFAGITRYRESLPPLPPEYYVITGLPIWGFLAVYLARFLTRKRGSPLIRSGR